MFHYYKNGNYLVKINDQDGTKERITMDDNMHPDFPENIDITISTRCNGGCDYCYMGCDKNGTHANLLCWSFWDSLQPYTEVALNGNDLTNPELEALLIKLSARHIFVNMTVNQIHFMQHFDKLLEWKYRKLIWGLGVSLKEASKQLVDKLNNFGSDAILHTIAGIITKYDIEYLSNRNIKLLVLGFKLSGRGKDYYYVNGNVIARNIGWLKQNIINIIPKFRVISFDNLALEQLDIKKQISDNQWNNIYMGDDGEFTFYIDLVKGTYAKNSISCEEYPINGMTIRAMFEDIKTKSVGF